MRQIGDLGDDGTGRLRRAIVVVGDVSVEADVESIVQETMDAFGGLDVVCSVLCARSACCLRQFYALLDGSECGPCSSRFHHRRYVALRSPSISQ